jgi:hypothetical protein
MHRLERLSPDRIEAEWERIGALLQPAIAHDEKRMAIDVYRDLMTGALELFDLDLYRVKGVAVTEIGLSTANLRCMWIVYIGGQVLGSPREWIGRVRTLMSYFEGIARAEGCAEMRIEGRDWSRMLPAYERLIERPGRNELRRML